MRGINECFEDTRSIKDLINGDSGEVNEGLRDVFNKIKDKFKHAFEWLKGIVVKVGSYILPVDEHGNVQPAITPLTAGQAYKDGEIDKTSTFVYVGKDGAKITGLNNRIEDALKMVTYKEKTIKYWDSIVESIGDDDMDMVNEVKLQSDDPEAKYNVIVDNDELKAEITAVLNDHNQARLMIWGAPGIGKTAILMNILKEMKSKYPDYKLIVKTLANETPDNFTLPKYVDVDGGEYATDVPKTWLPVYKPSGDPFVDEELDQKCGNGLLFIDELSRATPQVLNVVLPLVNEGIFNGYKLGSGWTIICASNRMEDEMSGQSQIGNALANRFSQVFYEPTVHTWRKWADQQNFISPLLLQWLSMPETENMSGGKFYYMDPNENIDNITPSTLMCTPRSWTNAMRNLAVYSQTGTLEGFTIFDIPTKVIARSLNKFVPASAVDSFLAFLETIKGIGDFDKAVREVWTNEGKGLKITKANLRKIYLPLAQLICSAHADKLPTSKEFESLAKWLVDQNSDQLASYVLDVFKNVFLANAGSDKVKNVAFVIHWALDKARAIEAKPESQRTDKEKQFLLHTGNEKIITNVMSNLMKSWKIRKIDDFPDYNPGLRLIAAKYQASFKSAVVDGITDALG